MQFGLQQQAVRSKYEASYLDDRYGCRRLHFGLKGVNGRAAVIRSHWSTMGGFYWVWNGQHFFR
jgi:hypothetical protein